VSDKHAEVYEAIKKHLVGRGIDESVVKPEADLQKDVGLDSLDVTELTLGLEDEFGIEIPDEDLEGLTSVQDAVELVERKVAVST
jgi:acyl carrier protein